MIKLMYINIILLQNEKRQDTINDKANNNYLEVKHYEV